LDKQPDDETTFMAVITSLLSASGSRILILSVRQFPEDGDEHFSGGLSPNFSFRAGMAKR